ncbi:MAG: DoxX family protein [Bacteroidota bacterium]|nr:DoxX family protein [Bacteroidota bacterium]
MNTKSTKIIFWISTGLIALFILPGIFFLNNPQATEGMKHLGLPLWFHYELGIGKFIGGLILLIPFFPKRIKEWVYVALGIDMLSAVIGLTNVDGFVPMSFAPLVTFAILLVSYTSFHKLQNTQKS